MHSVNIVFPHQIFQKSELINNGHSFYLIEEWLFFKQYQFHKQKLAFHHASMKMYASYLHNLGKNVTYIESISEFSDIRKLFQNFRQSNIECIHFIDPVDDWLESRINTECSALGIDTKVYQSPSFINDQHSLSSYFTKDKTTYFQTNFYKQQRKQLNILIDSNLQPIGGKWSFDDENRKRYPKKKIPPQIHYPKSDHFYTEAVAYVNTHFAENLGSLSSFSLYPYHFDEAVKWLDQFLEFRFAEFGTFEDAIVKNESILHHSVLTPVLNTGILTPEYVIKHTLEFAQSHSIPINSLEGFIRQIIGWREFIRGLYISVGRKQRSTNFWNFNRSIPKTFYTATTGIEPLDDAIKKCLSTGYNHHIERLMIIGNFMVLCEFNPDEVYQWFMELYIDAYDWVMVPNVYGMSQFADGGLMSTKPYISGSNYILKMSDYNPGPWQEIWDALFWRFMHTHRNFFEQNPRLSMLIRNLDRMSDDKLTHHITIANQYLKTLS